MAFLLLALLSLNGCPHQGHSDDHNPHCQQMAETPEPATPFLIGLGLAGVIYITRRRK